MSAKYWIRNDFQTEGPFDQLQIRGLVALGRIRPATEISVDKERWRKASEVRGLLPTNDTSTIRADEEGLIQQTKPLPVSLASPADQPTDSKRGRRSLTSKLALALVGLLAVGVGVFQAFRTWNAGSITGCTDQDAIDLAISIIYEDIAKRTQDLQLAAAMGKQVTKADLAAMELRIRRYITLGLSGISTVGKSAKKVQCKASLRLTVTSEGTKSDLVYFGKTYSDGDAISYSVRQTDDGDQIYVHIPAE